MASEAVDLLGQVGVLEVGGELGHGRGAGVGDVIDASQRFFAVQGQADLAIGVACVEQVPQPDPPVVGDGLRGRHEHAKAKQTCSRSRPELPDQL